MIFQRTTAVATAAALVDSYEGSCDSYDSSYEAYSSATTNPIHDQRHGSHRCTVIDHPAAEQQVLHMVVNFTEVVAQPGGSPSSWRGGAGPGARSAEVVNEDMYGRI